MKVRVKPGKWGIYGGVKRRGSKDGSVADTFTIVARKHSTQMKAGKPVVISVKQQFSPEWMEEIDPPSSPKVPLGNSATV